MMAKKTQKEDIPRTVYEQLEITHKNITISFVIDYVKGVISIINKDRKYKKWCSVERPTMKSECRDNIWMCIAFAIDIWLKKLNEYEEIQKKETLQEMERFSKQKSVNLDAWFTNFKPIIRA